MTIKEFRDAGRLEKDLAVKGVRADITYLPQRMRCGNDSRGVVVDPPQPHPLPTKASELPKAFQDMLAHRPPVLMLVKKPGTPNTFKIFPRRIKDGQTLVLELGESQRTRLWKLSTYVVTGPVRPCVFENDPNWN